MDFCFPTCVLLSCLSLHLCVISYKATMAKETEYLWTIDFFFQGIFVQRSSSSSIASPNYLNFFHTSSPGMSCSWEIETSNGYILELTFDKMSISSCSGCSCGYVRIFDGISSNSPLIGTFCGGNSPSLISSKGSDMFVKYYGLRSYDEFRATIHSKKGNSKFSQYFVYRELL